MLLLVCWPASKVASLLVGIDVPDHVIGQAEDLVSCPLGHLGEAFRFGLVLECVAGEVDS